MSRQDSAFYTDDSSPQVVWDEDPHKRFYVVRAGEMRIHAKENPNDTHTEIIRYTDQLESFGIKDDQTLAEWTDKGDDVFAWINNSWFEVYDDKDPEFFSEPYHTLKDAIDYAEMLSEQFGADKQAVFDSAQDEDKKEYYE